MKIGETLHISKRELRTNDDLNYRCNIIGKDKDYLYIDYPINVETSKTEYITNNTALKAIYIGSDKVPLNFPTKVVKRVKLTVPALALEIPGEDKIKRVQRREFVRISTAVDIAIHSIGSVFQPFTTVTSDISGGGVSIILPKDLSLEEECKLMLWIVLPMSSGEISYVKVEGKVVREKIKDKYIRTASVSFIAISSNERQKIIRFCFEKQREARSKGLEL